MSFFSSPLLVPQLEGISLGFYHIQGLIFKSPTVVQTLKLMFASHESHDILKMQASLEQRSSSNFLGQVRYRYRQCLTY